MHFKRRESNRLEDISFDDMAITSEIDPDRFSRMGSLTENELEFLRSKRIMRSRIGFNAPDPRKGDYEPS
jgi:hypothetical protein